LHVTSVQFSADSTGLTAKTMWSIWCVGLLTGLALILAIGAQNAFVLSQGIRREHVGVVVALCIASDVMLILGGTYGIGALVSRFPTALTVLKWGGTAYLAWWAARSFAADARWVFASGAVAGSAIWFPALGYGARALSGMLSSPGTRRIVELATGLLMLVLAFNLMLG
jgi:L-lysine exporter family protein LysE/ArgO